MKTNFLLAEVVSLLILTSLLPAYSLAQGVWTKKTDFAGSARSGIASFSIGNKVYIVNGDTNSLTKDFWEWDQTTNAWTRKADFPLSEKGYSYTTVCFSIGSKGYVFFDHYEQYISTNKLWEYDSEKNTWSQKASLPTTLAISDAVSFSIGTKGYIGTGIKTDGWDWSLTKEFWEWDQATNIWTQKADFGGILRAGAVGFSIGGKGYIATGFGEVAYTNEFWEWDQATNKWIKKADFLGVTRRGAVGFSIGNKGYVATGKNYDKNTLYNDFWEWDQATNVWTQKADFGGMARYIAVGFSIDNKGYVGLGIDNYPGVFQDIWEYDPLETTGITELANENNAIYPNPCIGKFSISSTGTITAIEVYNQLGKRIYADFKPQQQTPKEIDLSSAPKGIYVVKIKSGNGIYDRKIVVQ